jgi:tetratricopeptide (TPR) repeat protein
MRYGVHDVEKLLKLPRSTIRALIDAGFVAPGRGPRRAWLFSFQDLIVLRTAKALAAAKVPRRRITRSMKELRRHLPEAMPLSGLSICAEGDRVVVKEGGSRWQAESGQYLLEFDGNPAAGSLSVIERAPAEPNADSWLAKGLALESGDPEAALQAYEKALAIDATCIDAHINGARLLHETGRLADAERAYREAIKTCAAEPVLFYNFGVLLDDMGRKAEAVQAYQAALRGDPRLADCHYNLALIYEESDKLRDAIRHMAQYRKLTGIKLRRPDDE